tara:strand:- start:67 stop:648 length:582 start_codon:yes stop_codon:yes gene_type:complete
VNNPDSKLKDFIHHEKNVLPESLCDDIVNDIKESDWTPHTWYRSVDSTSASEKTKELDVQDSTIEQMRIISPHLYKVFSNYSEKYKFNSSKTDNIAYQFSTIRFNRYRNGQIMRQHHDHIHSLFNGTKKGIPVLSVILNFNNDYKGGQLYFWHDYEIELGKGDIIMFPSLFMYPHGVKEPTEGERFSGVCWAW